MTHDRTNAGNIEMWQILSLLWSIIKHQPLYNICTNLIKIKTNVTMWPILISRVPSSRLKMKYYLTFGDNWPEKCGPNWILNTAPFTPKLGVLIGHMPDQLKAREQCDKSKSLMLHLIRTKIRYRPHRLLMIIYWICQNVTTTIQMWEIQTNGNFRSFV